MNHDNTNTSLAVTGSIIGQGLTAQKFTELDALIQKLGDRSTELTPDEKATATNIVEDWTTSVTDRIQENATRASETLHFLAGKPMYGSTVDDNIEMFHDVIGDTPEYTAYIEAIENLEAIQSNRPISIPTNDSMTIAEAEKTEMENQAAIVRFNREVSTAEYRLRKAIKAYITMLNNLPDIKAVKSNLNSYKRKATRMANDCRDKASKAKLNIAISDKETRKLLQDMLDFTKSI